MESELNMSAEHADEWGREPNELLNNLSGEQLELPDNTKEEYFVPRSLGRKKKQEEDDDDDDFDDDGEEEDDLEDEDDYYKDDEEDD